MPVYIEINDCHECPHRGHKGGFGAIAYVPTCTRAQRDLPYTAGCAGPARYGSPMVVATQKPGIPEWCPLRTNDPENKSEDEDR